MILKSIEQQIHNAYVTRNNCLLKELQRIMFTAE